MTILTAGSGCSKLSFLPMLYCAPFLFYITVLFTTYVEFMPIKLFNHTIQLTLFLHKPAYLLMLQTPDSKITNHWYQTYELFIQNLRTTIPFWYKLQILKLQTTNPFCYKLQIIKLQTTIPFCYKLQILILQTNNPFCYNLQILILRTSDPFC